MFLNLAKCAALWLLSDLLNGNCVDDLLEPQVWTPHGLQLLLFFTHCLFLSGDQINPHLPQRQLRRVDQRGGRGPSSPESLTFPELSFLFSALMKPEAMFPLTLLLLQRKLCLSVYLSVSRLWTTSPSSCTSWPWRHSCCVWGLQEWRSTRVRKPRRPWRSSRLRRRGWPSRPRSSSTSRRKTEQRREAAVHRYCTTTSS